MKTDIYDQGYKAQKTASELNAFTEQERITRCGYTVQHWNRMGGGQFSIREKTFRNNPDEDVVLDFLIEKEEEDV